MPIYDMPIAVTDIAVHMAWRAWKTNDPALLWLREAVVTAMLTA